MAKLKQGNSMTLTIVGENGAYKQARMAQEGLPVGLEGFRSISSRIYVHRINIQLSIPAILSVFRGPRRV